MKTRGLVLFIGFAAVTAGCGASTPVVKPPTYAPSGEATSDTAINRLKPLVVSWPDADRGELESVATKGLVVVRYVGRKMEILSDCRVSRRAYGYSSFTPETRRVVISDANQLGGAFPAGDVGRLSADLQNGGELDLEMTSVGRWHTSKPKVWTSDLRGSCRGATHVVVGMTVGAFTLSRGAHVSVAGKARLFEAGARAASTTSRDVLDAAGDNAACRKERSGDGAPPQGCAAPLRVSLAPVAKAPPCKKGTRWDGSRCAAESSGGDDDGVVAGGLLVGLLLLGS